MTWEQKQHVSASDTSPAGGWSLFMRRHVHVSTQTHTQLPLLPVQSVIYCFSAGVCVCGRERAAKSGANASSQAALIQH